jgi:hypothetical protein
MGKRGSGKNSKNSPKYFQLNYNSQQNLRVIYGQETFCGYIRAPRLIEEEKKYIAGYCSLIKSNCLRELPMRGDSCTIFKEFHSSGESERRRQEREEARKERIKTRMLEATLV